MSVSIYISCFGFSSVAGEILKRVSEVRRNVGLRKPTGVVVTLHINFLTFFNEKTIEGFRIF